MSTNSSLLSIYILIMYPKATFLSTNIWREWQFALMDLFFFSSTTANVSVGTLVLGWHSCSSSIVSIKTKSKAECSTGGEATRSTSTKGRGAEQWECTTKGDDETSTQIMTRKLFRGVEGRRWDTDNEAELSNALVRAAVLLFVVYVVRVDIQLRCVLLQMPLSVNATVHNTQQRIFH